MHPSEFRDPPPEHRPLLTTACILPPGAAVAPTTLQALPIDCLGTVQALGFGGVVTGLNRQNFLDSPEHWHTLRAGLAELRRLGMRAWIWDERGRPSGKAAGKVVARYPQGQARGLLYAGFSAEGSRRCTWTLPAGQVVAAWALPWQGDHPTLDGALPLDAAIRDGAVTVDLPPGRWLVASFVERALHTGTFAHDYASGDEPYINILDRRAVEIFRDVAYEAFRANLADYFGSVIQGFQTDEPMLITTAFPVRTRPPWHPADQAGESGQAGPEESVFPPYPAIPWLADLPERFARRYGYDLLPCLPALCHDIGPQTARICCDFYRLIGELCGRAYSQTLGDWCRAQGLKLKIHPLGEESLVVHTALEGSIYPFWAPADAPAADLLSASIETFKARDQCLPAPKMASSVAHAHGRTEVICDFADYYQYNAGLRVSPEQLRGCVGWVYVQGVTSLANLCDWRARPAEEWRRLNAYAARLGYCLSSGTHIADLAVLYPITTVWAHYVPSARYLMLPPIGSLERPKIWSEIYAPEAMAWEVPFREAVWTLLEHQRDLDIVDDQALSEARCQGGRLLIAGEAYRALILPPMDVIDQETLRAAADFARSGGLVIAFHPLPSMSAQHGEDRDLRQAVQALFGARIPFAGQFTVQPAGEGRVAVVADLGGLLKALAELIPPDIQVEPATPAVLGLHRQVQGRHVYFLTNNGPQPVELTVTLRTVGRPQVWDPWDGSVVPGVEHQAAPQGTRLRLALDGYAGKLVLFD